MIREALCCGTSLLVIACGSGCQMAGLLRENAEAIETTNQAIAANTTTMAAITQAMKDLESTLREQSSMKEAMQGLAALGPTFNRVADLDGPMKDLAGLREPMVQLSALKGSLDQAAELEKPLSDVARLEEPLEAVGQLGRPASALTRFNPTQLAASMLLALLAFFALLFLTIWGAIRLALRSGRFRT